MHPCIDPIDSLLSLGVKSDLALPAIASIGEEIHAGGTCHRGTDERERRILEVFFLSDLKMNFKIFYVNY